MTAVLEPGPAVLVHRYQPRGTARVLLQRRDREIVVGGPAGTGKSRACLVKVLLAALKYPGMRALFARQVADSLRDSTMVEWRDVVAKELIDTGECVYYSGSKTEPPGYKFSNGSRVSLGGLDKPSKIMSRQYDMIFIDEATELSLIGWQALTTRMRHGRMPYRQILAACNPDMPSHWLKQRADEGIALMLFSQHWENPRWYEDLGPAEERENMPAGIPDGAVEEHEGRLYRLTADGVEYIKGVLGTLTGVMRLRMLDGTWAAAEGVIFDTWNPAVHNPPAFPIPTEWPRWWVVDFGYKNPFCCQWWAESPDGQLVMYREIYMTRRLVEDHAREMLRLVTRVPEGVELTADDEVLIAEKPAEAIAAGLLEWTEPEPQSILADHDAEDRATLERHLGRGTTAATKTVTRGIQAVQKRLVVQGNGRPQLVILQGALVERDPKLKAAGKPQCTAQEIPGYIWEPEKEGRAPKEEPHKENDHGCDDVRYIVAHRDLRIRIRDRDNWLEG